MSVKSIVRVAALAAATGLGASAAWANITIPTVPIGIPGNAPDPLTGGLYGSVAYTYNIGQTEVTNAQYAAFLNAVAVTDTNDLYNANMAGSFGGITRSGSSGSYSYATVSGRANHPVNYVSFWDATRFANWLHNGQPTGVQDNSTTEDGAYTLTPAAISGNTVTRNAGAQWALPSENEWYKAAFHQPAGAGGDADDYWLYTTSSNGAPSSAQANFFLSIGNTTAVGSYAANYSGAFDMGGNVAEWNELISQGSGRGMRGGSFTDSSFDLRSDLPSTSNPVIDHRDWGFRVVQVPTTNSAALLAIGGLAAARRRRVV